MTIWTFMTNLLKAYEPLFEGWVLPFFGLALIVYAIHLISYVIGGKEHV